MKSTNSDIFLLDVRWQTLFQLCESWVGSKTVLILVDPRSDRQYFFADVVTISQIASFVLISTH